MRKLILVRHSETKPNPAQPKDHWTLTDEGLRRAELLARRLTPYFPFVLASSTEAKAKLTADAIAERFGVPIVEIADLREHHRHTVRWLDSQEAYEAAVARFFTQPDELVLGEETASEALQRFENGVSGLFATHPSENCVAVTHGSVITLFMAKHTGVDPVAFWKELTQPWYAALSAPTFKVLEIVRDIV